MAGPWEAKLTEAIGGMNEHDLTSSHNEWYLGAQRLKNVADALEKAAPAMEHGFGGKTGEEAGKAFTHIAGKAKHRSGQMGDAAEALGRAHTVMKNARDTHRDLGPEPAKPELKPDPTRSETDEMRAQQHHSQALGIYSKQMDAREEKARVAMEDMDRVYGNSTDTMREVHGEPDERPGQVSTAPAGGGAGAPPTFPGHTPTTGITPVHTGTVHPHDPTGDPTPNPTPTPNPHPNPHPHPVPNPVPTPHPDPVPTPDPVGPSGTPQGPSVTGPGTVSPIGGGSAVGPGGGTGSSGGSVAGGVGAAGLGVLGGAGALGGLGSSSGISAVPSAGTTGTGRPIGASGRPGGAGSVLGRGTGSAAGRGAGAGRGSGVRSGAGAGTRGGGRTAGGRGSGTRGTAGGRGAGTRGRAGTGAGGMAGRGGGKKDEKDRSSTDELFDTEKDWLDDDGMAPPLLD